jgi:hypothetical protein
MSQQSVVLPRDEMVDTMIDLAHLSQSQPIVVAGCGGIELYLALKRRGFFSGVLAAACRAPGGRHSAGLITGDHSYQAIEASITQVSRFLSPTADVVISIGSQASGLGAMVRTKLQQLGFRIEAGARCRQGFVLAAHRQDFGQNFGTIANVA